MCGPLCEALKGPKGKASALRGSQVWWMLLREAGPLLFLMVAFNVSLKNFTLRFIWNGNWP